MGFHGHLEIKAVRIINIGLGLFSFLFLFFILFYISIYFLLWDLKLEIRVSMTSQITITNIIQSYDTEKVIEGSQTNNAI